jgi:hypothetical protein
VKKFGEPFKKYEPFGIAHMSFLNAAASLQNIQELGVDIADLNELTELRPSSTCILATGKSVERNLLAVANDHLSAESKKKILKQFEVGVAPVASLRVVTNDHLSAESKKKILKQFEVGVAPVARVYPISPNQSGLSIAIKKTMPYFNYYVAELGLNVLVGQGAKIPELRFEVDLYSDGKDRTDVTTNSVAPTDSIKTVVAVSGKISIGVSKLLELIPLGHVVSGLIPIDINPIEFKWELKKYDIDTSGPLNYKASWRVYNTENVQSFNPMMVLRTKKEISKIWANARVIYALKTGSIFTHTEIYSDEKKVLIQPL